MDEPKSSGPESKPRGGSSASAGHRTRIAKVTKRAHFRFRWIAYGILIFAAAGLAAKPAYRWTKQIRAQRLVAEVERLMRDDQILEAGRPLQVASQLAPNNPAVIRASARYLSRLLRPEALAEWQHLVDMGAATRADRQRFAEVALRMRRLDLAGEQLRILTAAENPEPEVCYLAVQHFRLRRDFKGAVEAAREAMQVAQTNQDSRFLLGTVLVESPDPQNRREGRALLVDLAIAGEARNGEALDLLLLHPELPATDLRRMIGAFGARTNLSLPERIRLASLKARLDPSARADVGDELAQSVSSLSLGSRVPVAVWLGSRGLHDQVLRLLPADLVMTNAAALPVRLEALVRSGRWEELDPLLARTDLPLETVYGGAFHAAQAVHQGNRALGETQLRNSLEAASNRVDRLQFVSRYAEHLGYPLVAIEAQMGLMFSPGRSWQSAQEVLRLVAPLEDIAKVTAVIDRLAGVMPGDPSVTAEQGYYRLLLNEDVPGTRNRLTELRARVNGNPWIEIVSAFAEIKSGNTVEALTRIEDLQLDWPRQPLRWQALYAMALGAGQRRDAAREAAIRIDLRQLRAPERDLVRPWL